MKIISKKHKINASVVFVVDVVLKSQFVVAEIKKIEQGKRNKRIVYISSFVFDHLWIYTWMISFLCYLEDNT